ncbi:preprotein translocase subunit SecG [Candidatus Endobugula sertula]|uniref:Protein-export membrane protein SecG n=1 Tax=Candidatus Endobugula sertula TaxID=62101 RepID=A0A1D2QNC6_9GAMM|nr:preprotein translocase subunit SecG [Candidatus Endobugula sertula]
METIVIVIHVLVALAIIGLILLQRGKGAEAGASFGGGASQTVFGSEGSGNFFAKVTAILAFIFFATSFSLAIIAKNKTNITLDIGIPQETAEQPIVESEIPIVEPVETEADLPTVEPEPPTVPEPDSQ